MRNIHNMPTRRRIIRTRCRRQLLSHLMAGGEPYL